MKLSIYALQMFMACISTGCVILPAMRVSVVERKADNCVALVSMAEPGVLLFNIRTDRVNHAGAVLDVGRSYAIDSLGMEWKLVGRRQPYRGGDSFFFPLQVRMAKKAHASWDESVGFTSGDYLVQVCLLEHGDNYFFKADLSVRLSLAAHPVLY